MPQSMVGQLRLKIEAVGKEFELPRKDNETAGKECGPSIIDNEVARNEFEPSRFEVTRKEVRR